MKITTQQNIKSLTIRRKLNQCFSFDRLTLPLRRTYKLTPASIDHLRLQHVKQNDNSKNNNISSIFFISDSFPEKTFASLISTNAYFILKPDHFFFLLPPQNICCTISKYILKIVQLTPLKSIL